MIRGLDTNRIIVGAYVDPKSGGICPMLAAHRNGGRTDVASFARAWDEYTNARRPRRATRREVHTLRSLLVQSLDVDATIEHASIAELAAQLRAEREAFRCALRPPATAEAPALAAPALLPDEPEDAPLRVKRSAQLERRDARGARAGRRRAGEREELKDLFAAAEEQLANPRPAERID